METSGILSFPRLLALAFLLIGSVVFLGCAKKDCEGPCSLVESCVKENISAARPDQLRTLHVQCRKKTCPKYYAEATRCYKSASVSEDPCQEYARCIYEQYLRQKQE